MDYLVFITALLLTLAGLVGLLTALRKLGAMPFSFGLALLALALLQAWPLIWLRDVSLPLVVVGHTALMLLATTLLVHSALAIRKIRRSGWIGLFVFVSGGALWLVFGSSWIAWVFWPLGAVAAVALLFPRRQEKRGDFRYALLLMALGAFFNLLQLPPAVAYHAFWSQIALTNLAALQQVPIIVGAACWLLGVFLWYRASVWRSLPFRPRQNGESQATPSPVFSLLFLGILVVGWPAINALTSRVDEHRRQELIQQSLLAVYSLEPVATSQLQGVREEIKHPEYLKLKNELRRLAEVGGYSFAYLMFLRDGEWHFLADSAEPGSEDESVIGDVWKSAPERLKAALFERKRPGDDTITLGPYTDEWGTWVTAVSAMPDWKIGDAQVFLGVDRSAEAWQTSLLRIRQGGMGVVSVLILIVLISFVLYRMNVEAKWHIAHSEERLRMALRGANLAAWEYRPASGAFHLEAEWRDLLKRRDLDSEVTIAVFCEWLHPDDRAGFVEIWKKLEAGNLPEIETELRIVNQAGDLQFISLRGRGLGEHADSMPVLISGTAQDVTLFRKEKETLRVLSAALDAAANAVVITDATGTIEWVNPAFTKVSGYTSSDVIGGTTRLLKSGVHTPDFYQAMWSTLSAGEVWTGEITNRHKDGHLFIEEATITPVIDNYLRITHYIAVKQDITARKRSEEELERSRRELRRLALVAENTTNAVVIADTAGRIEWVNPGFERITGYSASEVQGMLPGSILQGPRTDPAVRQRMHDAVAEGRGFKEVLVNYHKDLTPYRISIECVPLREADGKHIGFMAVEEDITERVLGEEAVQRQRTNLQHINSTLLKLGESYEDNLDALTHLVGEIFGADCALYNRLDGDMLKTLGRYKTPPELPFQDTAEGHLCFDVINSPDGFLCVPNLQDTHYAKTDPNVTRFQLDTYIGQGVQVEGTTLGALSVIFSKPFVMEDNLKECLSLIAQAIGREELLHMGRQKLDQLAVENATASTRLSTLLQNLHDAVLVEDSERRVIFANPAFEAMFGIKASTVLGVDCGILAVGAAQAFEDPDGFLLRTVEAVRTRQAIQGELLILKNGCALVRNFAPIGDGGVHYGFLWHYRDVTRQRNNELLLNAVASLAATILEKPLDSAEAWSGALAAIGAPIGIDRTYVFRNHLSQMGEEPACSQIGEWARSGASASFAKPELQNLRYSDLGIARWHQTLSEGKAITGLVKDFPSGERARLESQGILSIAVVPVLVDGKLWGFLGFDDRRRERQWESEEIALLQSAAGLISARLELQRSVKALVRSESKFRAMFELSPVGMALNDLESGRFLDANQALLRMVGYSLGELKSIDLSDLTPADFIERDKEMVASLRATGSYGPYEKEYFLRSGERLPVLLSGMLVRGEDGKEFVWSIIQDIAERKRWENSLRTAKDAADAANRSKSAFLATMSHEIRTPLNAIIGMSSLLTESPLNATQQDYAETIINAGETLLELINDILDYSKIEAGRIDLEFADFLLEDVLVESVNLLGGPVAQKGLEMSCYLDPSLPMVIRGDRTRIKQVLINLISNAVKFTASGEVSVRVEACMRRTHAAGIRFTVTDSGVGMTPDVIANLFQPFQQADSSVTRKFGGTGLGLAICRRLAELMNADIHVESTPGEGSCFTFEIPCVAGDKLPRPNAAKEWQLLAGRAVLILDDNSTNRRFLNDQCLLWKALPTNAASAVEALEQIEKADAPFDLIFADYQMPGMDGVEFARRFRSRYPDSKTIVILLSSAYQRLNPEDRLLFDKTLDKPIRPSALSQTLADYFGASTPPSPSPIAQPVHGHSLKILVAEDNATNQKVIMGMLQIIGHSAALAQNGALALEAVQQEAFDLILMDVQMPVMDGLEAARLIRKESNGASAYIVALTANAFKEDREECLRAGMNEYLSKPVQFALLKEIITRLVGKT